MDPLLLGPAYELGLCVSIPGEGAVRGSRGRSGCGHASHTRGPSAQCTACAPCPAAAAEVGGGCATGGQRRHDTPTGLHHSLQVLDSEGLDQELGNPGLTTPAAHVPYVKPLEAWIMVKVNRPSHSCEHIVAAWHG